MPYVKSLDRFQLQMSSLDMQVDPDSMARIIDAFVDSLDLKGMGFYNATPSVEGRPAYHPGSLLKLYLYGHQNDIRSSRKLMKACHVNLELKWLMKGAEPDFRTISDFRKNHVDQLKEVFLEFNRRLKDLTTGFFSVDGTKIIANNGRDKNLTASKLDDRIDYLEGHIDDYMRQLDQQDKEETSSGTLSKEELDAKLMEARDRLQRYKLYREYMEQNNLSQLSLTDADARLMKNRNGFTVSHNVQAAVDSETHLISDFKVTSDPADYGQLESTLHKQKAQNPDKILEAVADKGYQSPEDMAKCLENGIIPHVILPDGKDTCEVEMSYEANAELHPESTAADELSKCLHAGVVPEAYQNVIDSIKVQEKEITVRPDTDTVAKSPFQNEEEMIARAQEGYFVRDPERNIVYCPAGKRFRQNTVTKNNRIRYINKMACRHCPYRSRCYTGKKGYKEIEFTKDEFIKPNGKWLKANGEEPVFHKRRLKKERHKVVTITIRPDRQKMAQRMCLSEHPFGTIKRAFGSSYFLLRGNKKVTGEFALFALAYNMKRASNLLGFDEMMRRMGSSFYALYSFFNVPVIKKRRQAPKLVLLAA